MNNNNNIKGLVYLMNDEDIYIGQLASEDGYIVPKGIYFTEDGESFESVYDLVINLSKDNLPTATIESLKQGFINERGSSREVKWFNSEMELTNQSSLVIPEDYAEFKEFTDLYENLKFGELSIRSYIDVTMALLERGPIPKELQGVAPSAIILLDNKQTSETIYSLIVVYRDDTFSISHVADIGDIFVPVLMEQLSSKTQKNISQCVKMLKGGLADLEDC